MPVHVEAWETRLRRPAWRVAGPENAEYLQQNPIIVNSEGPRAKPAGRGESSTGCQPETGSPWRGLRDLDATRRGGEARCGGAAGRHAVDAARVDPAASAAAQLCPAGKQPRPLPGHCETAAVTASPGRPGPATAPLSRACPRRPHAHTGVTVPRREEGGREAAWRRRDGPPQGSEARTLDSAPGGQRPRGSSAHLSAGGPGRGGVWWAGRERGLLRAPAAAAMAQPSKVAPGS